MRLANVLAVILVLAACCGPILADPNTPAETKPWSYDFGTPRAIYPETGANDTCPGTQVLLCGDLIDPGEISATTDDDWYQVYLTAGTIATIGTDVGTGGCAGVGDSYLYLYSPDCATLLTSDDDSGPGLYSLIANYTVPSTGYYNVKCQSYGHYYTGCYKLFVTCTIPQPPPANDLCSGAIELPGCATGSVDGDLTYATNDYDPGSGGCATGYPEAGRDVVYKVVLNAGDIVDLTYTGNAFDAAFYIVTDCANVPGTCVAGADAGYNVETIHWAVTASNTYYIICDAYGTNAGTLFTLDYAFACPPPVGACCYPDGTCVVTTEQECIAEQRTGIWMGPGTDCDPNPCAPPMGACCFPDCSCQVLTEAECGNAGGIFFGPGTSCDPMPCDCPPVACCLPDGSCWVVTQFECDAMGGEWTGYSDCAPNPCVGACCFADCTCLVLTEADCAASGGVFMGGGTSCDPLPCPCPPGACCFPDGTCVIVVESACVGGTWMGMGTVCSPNPCPQPGACCFVDGTCEVVLEEECLAALGDWYGDTDPDCEPSPCPPPTPVERKSWGQIKSRYR